MRHLNIDWQDLFGHLTLWQSLPELAQRGLFSLKNNEQIDCTVFEPQHVKALVDSGLMSYSADRKRLRVVDGGREFFKVIRAMHRHRIDVHGNERALESYASEHLTQDEQLALMAGDAGEDYDHYHYGYGRPSCEAAARQAWPQQFLGLTTAKQARAWENKRLPDASLNARFQDGAPYFNNAPLFDATARLLKAAMTWPKPVPLVELPSHVPDVDPSLLWQAVMASVRYLLLFPRLGDDHHNPVIGVWPQIAYLLHRPEPKPPKPVTPTETFHAPFLAEDITTVLVAAAAEPLRLLASGEDLYQKDFNLIVESMLVLPDWLFRTNTPRADLSDPRGDSLSQFRVGAAMDQCLTLKLLKVRQTRKGSARYETTQAGYDWLDTPLNERIRILADPWRVQPDTNEQTKARKRTRRSTLHVFRDGEFIPYQDDDQISPWMPSCLRWSTNKNHKKIDWRAAYTDALEGDKAQRFHPVEMLLAYHVRVNNPLLARRHKGTYGPQPDLKDITRRHGHTPSDLHIEDIWYNSLAQMIERNLIPLGAIETGWDGKQLSIRLHDIGRYTLGLTDTLDYQTQPEGTVIVQPNFEIVFMGPSPAAEAKLGRLAERTGQRMGAMFRITKASILAAAAAGIKANDALQDIQTISSKPLPDNVRREVSSWFNSTARIHLRQTWVVETPDKPTTTRVLATAGKHARQLTPTLVELTIKPSAQSALKSKLKKAGIFVS